MLDTQAQILVLLLIACAVAVIAHRMRLPYTIALVVAGVAVGAVGLPVLEGTHLTQEVLFTLLLPPLLFEAAFHVRLQDLRRNLAPVLLMATAGVVLSAGLTAVVSFAALQPTGVAPDFGWGPALVFGTLIAATDPVSVLALFRSLGVPPRLYLLIESESLINDGVAVVLFLIAAAAIGSPAVHGSAPELEGAREILGYGVRTFAWMAGVGTLVGAVIGAAASAATRHIDDHLIEITLTTLVAFGSFLAAEQLHASGVLSVVAAGIVTGSFGSRLGMSPTSRLSVESFWEYAAFVANSMIFLLVGLELSPASLIDQGLAIAGGFLAVLLGRLCAVYSLLPIADRLGEPIPRKWRAVLVWGGLRGSLSMVLAMGLPEDFPARDTMVHLVFGVVAASLLLQGLTMAPLLRRLGLSGGGASPRALDEAVGRRLAAEGALRDLEKLARRHGLDPATETALRERFETERAQALAAAEAVLEADPTIRSAVRARVLRHLSIVEKDAIREASHHGLVGREAAARLLAEIDAGLADEG